MIKNNNQNLNSSFFFQYLSHTIIYHLFNKVLNQFKLLHLTSRIIKYQQPLNYHFMILKTLNMLMDLCIINQLNELRDFLYWFWVIISILKLKGFFRKYGFMIVELGKDLCAECSFSFFWHLTDFYNFITNWLSDCLAVFFTVWWRIEVISRTLTKKPFDQH